MSYAQSSPFPPAFEPYSNDYAKQDVLQGGFDFYSFNSPADNLAPHPDLLEFENELDSTLAGFDATGLELLTVDSNDAFTTLRTDTPTCGPPSISSESASQYSSIYNYARTSYSSNNNYSPFPLGLEMELQRFKFDPVADYTGVQSTDVGGDPSVDPNSFGALPPTPPRSPATRTLNNPKGYPVRSSFSDYGPSTRSPEYYSPVNYTSSPMGQPTVSPSHVTTQLPVVPSISLLHPADDYKGDPRKKYKCHVCPRAFARAYNLKTHMATHDPNRLKPHVCPHHACGRSFSRKHDLGRHVVSIHREESVCSSHHSASSKKSIGVESATRSWCDTCGKGWVGQRAACDCHDVK